MGSYLVIIAVLIIFFCIRRRRRTAAVAWQILNQRKQNTENVVMKELAKQFIGASFIQLLQMTAAYRASLRKLKMEAWSLREVTADGKSSISTLSPVSDSIRERKTERKRTLCGTKSM